MLIKAAVLAFYLCIRMASAQGQELSGNWQLSDERPETGSLPESPARIMQLKEDGKSVTCTLIRDGAGPHSFTFTTDGRESKSKDGDRTLSIAAKWEGSALLVNTIVNGPASSYTQMDRWRVSRDRSRLTIRREVVRPRANAESFLVYTRKE